MQILTKRYESRISPWQTGTPPNQPCSVQFLVLLPVRIYPCMQEYSTVLGPTGLTMLYNGLSGSPQSGISGNEVNIAFVLSRIFGMVTLLFKDLNFTESKIFSVNSVIPDVHKLPKLSFAVIALKLCQLFGESSFKLCAWLVLRRIAVQNFNNKYCKLLEGTRTHGHPDWLNYRVALQRYLK